MKNVTMTLRGTLWLASFAASAAMAQDYNLVLKAGAGYTDNVTRTVFDAESAAAAIAGVEFTAQRTKGRLTLEGLADVSYLRFFGTDLADDDVLANADFRGTYQIIPDRFSWTAVESYAQLREDFLVPFSTANSQGFNQFSTGPDFRLPLSSNMDIEASARYARSNYESTAEFDSERVLASAGLTRRVSARSQAALRASIERFEVAEDVLLTQDRDFDRKELAAEFATQSPRTELSVQAGVTQVEGAAVDSDGPLVRVALRRRLTPSVTLLLDAGREFSTTGERGRRFRIDDAPASENDLLLPAAEPFEQTRYGGTLNYRRPRTSVSFSAAVIREDYQVSTFINRRLLDYRVAFQRRMTPQLDFSLQAGQTTDELESLPYDVDERLLGAALRWRFTRAMSLALSVENRERDGSFNGFDYSELSARLLLRYSPWSPDASTVEALEEDSSN